MASKVKDVKYDKKMYYIITFIQCVKLKTKLLAIPNRIKFLNFVISEQFC